LTKAMLCINCSDLVAPHRDWQTDRAWRWCECGGAGVRWRDGTAGLLEVTSADGPAAVRVLGINNSFLVAAVAQPPPHAEGWRDLHRQACAEVTPNYLFHQDRRACWALIVRPGESSDVTFVDYAEAKAEHRPSADPPAGSWQVTGLPGGEPAAAEWVPAGRGWQP
jgi:hypothetical protein